MRTCEDRVGWGAVGTGGDGVEWRQGRVMLWGQGEVVTGGGDRGRWG